MRIVGIFALLIFLPAIWGALASGRLRREHAMFLLGLSFFAGGFIPTDVALISWPMWSGTAKGIIIGLPDCLAIALIATRRSQFRSIAFTPLFAAHAVMVGLSIAMSTIPMASFFSLWQIIRVWLLFYAIAGEARDLRMLGYLLRGLAVALLLEAGVVAMQKARGVIEAPGTTSHRNTLAIMVELILMPMLAMVLDARREKLLWASVLAALFIVANGGSRAGLGLALFGILLTLGLSAIHSLTARKSSMVFAVLFVTGLAVPVALTTLSERFGSQSMFTKEGARDSLEAVARAISADYPFGIGAGMFVTTANTQGYSERAGVEWGGGTRAAPVHNVYLLERAELGWLGSLTYALLLIVPLIYGLRAAFRKPRTAHGAVVAGAAAALTVVLLHGFFEYAPITYDCMALIALNIGIIAGYIRVQKLPGSRRQEITRNRPQKSNATALSGASHE